MTTQATLDFTQRIENNSHSQAILKACAAKINNQCRIVLEALNRGEKLTVRGAMIRYGIGDLRRRIKDLKDFQNVDVKSKMVGHGFKEYFL